MWLAGSTRFLYHGQNFEAGLALSNVLTHSLALALSCWRRCCYVRRARWLVAVGVLQAHVVASAVCLVGCAMMAGR